MANLGVIVIPIEKIKKNDDEDKSALLITNTHEIKIEVSKFLKEIKQKQKRQTKCKTGYVKEGFHDIYGINPIDRYNFIIDRYNEDININENINLIRIPSIKILRRVYDMYTWICRLFFGVFLMIVYYGYRYNYSNNKKNRAAMLSYRKYIINDDLNITKKHSVSFILLCVFVFCISLYFIIVFFFIMIIPNILFTVYLVISYFIHSKNKTKVKDIFSNMIYDIKLDEKGQLNDYLTIENQNAVKYYDGCSYYDKLSKLSETRDFKTPETFMLYGDIFIREYEIISRSLYKQILNNITFMGVGYYFYQ